MSRHNPSHLGPEPDPSAKQGSRLYSVASEELRTTIQAIDADVYLFSECGNTSATQVKDLLDDWLPTGTAEGWHTHKDGDLVTAALWPLLETWSEVTKQAPVLVDVPAALGGPMLFVNSHLSCCASRAESSGSSECLHAAGHDAEETSAIRQPI